MIRDSARFRLKSDTICRAISPRPPVALLQRTISSLQHSACPRLLLWLDLAERILGSKNTAVPHLDVFPLRLHRVWIASYQLDSGERPAPCLLLHEPMERAHAVGIDETLLRLDAEKEALEQACRVGTGRGLKDGTRSDDEWRALASIDDFHRRTTFSQQQEFGLNTVGLHGTFAAGEPVRRIPR